MACKGCGQKRLILLPQKKAVEIVEKKEIEISNFDASSAMLICKDCEHFSKKYKLCIIADCSLCKGSVIAMLSNNYVTKCPIDKWKK